MRNTILLQYAPASSVQHLPAGIAQLAAVLHKDGHHVVQHYGHIIGTEYVLRAHGGDEIDRAFATIRDPQSDVFARHDARMMFVRVSKDINSPDSFSITGNNVLYVSKYQDGTIEGTFAAIKNRESHLWYQYFVDVEIPFALSIKPDVYGISIADERQFIPGIVLASLVKDALPGCLVVLGGNYWARVVEAFKLPETLRDDRTVLEASERKPALKVARPVD